MQFWSATFMIWPVLFGPLSPDSRIWPAWACGNSPHALYCLLRFVHVLPHASNTCLHLPLPDLSMSDKGSFLAKLLSLLQTPVASCTDSLTAIFLSFLNISSPRQGLGIFRSILCPHCLNQSLFSGNVCWNTTRHQSGRTDPGKHTIQLFGMKTWPTWAHSEKLR